MSNPDVAKGHTIELSGEAKDVHHVTGSDYDDRITTGTGNDTLIGGKGNDRLVGGAGRDTYQFSLGDGNDTIRTNNASADDHDTIRFLDIDNKQVTYHAQGKDLLIQYSENDSVRIEDFFQNGYYASGEAAWLTNKVKYFEFKDNVVLTLEELAQSKLIQWESQGSDLTGIHWRGDITVLSNPDVAKGHTIELSGEAKDVHHITGSIYDDQITTGAGNDVLIGGKGDDRLVGGAGSDTYKFRKGDGKDVISDSYNSTTDVDVIEFLDVSSAEARLHAEQYDLIIEYGKNDSIRINNFFYAKSANKADWLSNKIHQFKFTDKILGVEDLLQLPLLVTSKSNIGYNFYWDGELIVTTDDVSSSQGSTIQISTSKNQYITGASKNDTLVGNNGNDLLVGGRGNDTLNGGAGNDTYQFSVGDGKDIIISNNRSTEDKDQIHITDDSLENIHFQRNNYDLILHYGNEDQITVKDYYARTWRDRTVIPTVTDLKVGNKSIKLNTFEVLSLKSLSNYNDSNFYWSGNAELHLDTKSTEKATVHLYLTGNADIKGGKGDETLHGSYGGHTTFTGGAGNDEFFSHSLTDTFIFNKGDGVDHINLENDSFLGASHKIIFKGINSDEVIFTQKPEYSSNTLVIEYGDNDRVLINNFDRINGNAPFSEFVFADKTISGIDWLRNFSLNGTSSDNKLLGYNSISNTIHGNVGNDTLYGADKDDHLLGGDGDDTLYGQDGDDLLEGGDGHDVLYGNDGNDLLKGGGGDDSLYGEDGDDVLEGGAGNDTLNGGRGSDRYIFGSNWGSDQITGWYRENSEDEIDTIVFTHLNADQLVFWHDGNGHLIIYEALDPNNRIEIDAQFDNLNRRLPINRIEFADGTSWDQNDIIHYSVQGTSQDDIIHGLTSDDIIRAGGGNDTIHGIGPNSQLFGEDGNDTISGSGYLDGGDGDDHLEGTGHLVGGAGDDTLIGDGLLEGGKGNDLLQGQGFLDGGLGNDILRAEDKYRHFFNGLEEKEMLLADLEFDRENTEFESDRVTYLKGGKGNDTLYGAFSDDIYLFELGDGNDTIIERAKGEAYSNVLESFDIIRFGENISKENIEFKRFGEDLVIQHSNQNDSITVKDYFVEYKDGNDHHKINKIEFFDGTFVTSEMIENSIHYYADPNKKQTIGYRDRSEHIYGHAGDDQIFSGEGNDVLYGNEGNDYLDGGEGDDQLFGGKGNDTLRGGKGNDVLDGGEGDDHYVYYAGDGQDIIDHQGGGKDVLFFNDIREERLSFHRDGMNLVILVDNDSLQSVTVKDHFLGGEKELSFVQAQGGYLIPAIKISEMIKAAESGGKFDRVIEGTSQGEQLAGGSGADWIQGFDGDDKLFGMGGDDRLEGGNGDDYLSGGNGSGQGSGNDILLGGAGNDTLYGEDGDDLLIGGTGDDKYLYTEGGGVDTIDNTGGGNDGLFMNGIAANRISYHRDKDDLVILVDKDLQQQVRVLNHFLGGDWLLNYIQPGTGYTLSAAQIAKQLTVLPTDPGTDPGTNPGSGEGQNIVGTDKNDILRDTLGDDYMMGGLGDDLYIYTGGKDIIEEAGGYDRIRFSNGIVFSQVGSGLIQSGDDLILQVDQNPNNQITIKNFFLGGNYLIESVEFETGGSISAEQIFGAFGLTMPENTSIEWIEGTQGNDTLRDTLGNDYMRGGLGNDLYIYSGGRDVIEESGGHDRLRFSNNITFNQVGSGLTKSGDDLILRVDQSPDNQVTIKNFFLGGKYLIESIEFETGGSISADQIFGAFGLTIPVNRMSSSRMAMQNDADFSVDQSLHQLISAMAAFDSTNSSNEDFMVTTDQSLSRPMLTTSAY
ncbi:calcium-binding protein [Wohlfahrtiimonas chitiniclastica]|uniref:calcium-binding protein n=1 Tax=Wohlfahrtiimonas chitiniclastica TaxID=400946 RepID=UPI00034BED57|nr:calcium-binding protein [Wohlfahrtiimonas chitiniclastica]